ncbi:MAG: TonB-dependent receptor [Bacteroidota bacterium]
MSASHGVFAQTANPDNSLLPEINPQDIEIRSEFRASFPGLRRQPILGFNPKPRVYRIDPNRLPYLEPLDEAVANISVTQLDRPAPPERTLLYAPDRTRGYIQAGLGSFIAPTVDAYAFHQLSNSSSVAGAVDYRSSGDHLDQNSSFRTFTANGQWQTALSSKERLSVAATATSDFNYLGVQSQGGAVSAIDAPRKEYNGFGVMGSYSSFKNAVEGIQVHAGANVWLSSLDTDIFPTQGETNEAVFSFNASKKWAGNQVQEVIETLGAVRGGSYDSNVLGSNTWLDARGGLRYQRILEGGTRVEGTGEVAFMSDPNSSRVYLAPKVSITHQLKDRLQLSGSVYGSPSIQSVQDHHLINRFLTTGIQLQHQYELGAHAMLSVKPAKRMELFGGVQYQFIRDYAFYNATFQSSAGGLTSSTSFTLNFADATVFEVFTGTVYHVVPNQLSIDGKLYARSPRFSAGGAIPFEEEFGLEATARYSPKRSFTLTSWVEYLGQRPTNRNTNLDAFLLVNAEAEYKINNRIGVFAKVLNILGQEYQVWQGFEERPFQLFGGLTLKF